LIKTVQAAAACCIFAGIALAQAPVTPSPKIVVISHRGEHLHHPENTMPAFQAAIDAGADFYEVDVQTTSDGKLVLMHDRTVDRTTAATGMIKDMTFDQMRALDAGAKFSPQFAGTKVPTFDEALALAHGKIGVYVDTKRADAQQLVDTIVRNDMQDHVVVYSGNPFFLHDVQKARPGIKIMPEAYTADICKLMVRALHLQVLAFDADDFKDDVIACARQGNVQIYVDRMSVDNPDGWQKAIDMGANGIQTDRPAELVQYLRSHNMWVPGW
jgi:glycerophosphoryl diester phosphodiesterase